MVFADIYFKNAIQASPIYSAKVNTPFLNSLIEHTHLLCNTMYTHYCKKWLTEFIVTMGLTLLGVGLFYILVYNSGGTQLSFMLSENTPIDECITYHSYQTGPKNTHWLFN